MITPNVAALPFTSEVEDWATITNVASVELLMSIIAGAGGGDVFFVERDFMDEMAAEQDMESTQVHSDLCVILPRWLKAQNEHKPLPIDSYVRTHTANSKVPMQITHCEQGYFVHLPRKMPNE